MTPGRILVISNISWSFVWQRHQTLAQLFARAGSEVVFCEIPGTRRIGWRDARRVVARLWQLTAGACQPELPAGICLWRPMLLPATNRLWCAFNSILFGRYLRRRSSAAAFDLVIAYSVSRSALQLLRRLDYGKLIYDCTDNWGAVEGIPSFLIGDEEQLLAAADVTLVCSRGLYQAKRNRARRIELLPHGVLYERFHQPPFPASATPPTLLYYGHMHRQHLDFGWIDGLARLRPEWRVLLIGPVKTPFDFPPNVSMRGQVAHQQLVEHVAEAHALILPYAINDYTASVLPAKIYECLATGRPIVAAPLPELVAEFSGVLRFATGPSEAVEQVEQALAADTAAERDRRRALAQGNSWEARFAALQSILAQLNNRAS